MAHIGSCKMQDLRLNPAVPGYGKAPLKRGHKMDSRLRGESTPQKPPALEKSARGPWRTPRILDKRMRGQKGSGEWRSRVGMTGFHDMHKRPHTRGRSAIHDCP